MARPSGFARTANTLVCDGISIAAIGAAEGTPVYVYSSALMAERYRALDAAFGTYPHAIHYAFKANSTLAIVRLLRGLGSSADANSVWEIEVAQAAGYDARDIVFTGVGKSPTELECAVSLGLKAINVESAGELSRIEAIAARMGRRPRVAVRVNPDIDANSHPHISTGLKVNKFGVAQETARELLKTMAGRRSLELVAIHVHVGSQVTTLEPLRRAAAFAAELGRELIDGGVPLQYVDLGGGLGISYDGGPVPSLAEYVRALLEEVQSSGLPIVIEPGRSLVGPAGVLVARIVDLKPRDRDSDFVILDAGMTELLRPALYGAFHAIEPVTERAGARRTYEVVGPVCESSDIIGRDRQLPPLEVGDLVAIRDAGAYGAAMASNYNRRPMPAEVLVEDGTWRVIRRRQTIRDMLASEQTLEQ